MNPEARNGWPESDAVDDLREDIAARRAELADTVEALAARADVKARVRERVQTTKERAREQIGTAGDRLREQVGTAGGRLREQVDTARDRLREQVGPASDPRTGVAVARRSIRKLQRSIGEHPLGWAVAAGTATLLTVVLSRRWRR